MSENTKALKKCILQYDKLGYFIGLGSGLIASAPIMWISPEQLDDSIFVGLLLGVFLTTIGIFLHKKGNPGDEA